jgi:hypothetical protein
MFRGAGSVENNDPNAMAGENADAAGRKIYLGVSIAAIATLGLGIGANKTELALLVGGLVPIGGVILAIVALIGNATGGKNESEALTNFTSFSPAEEQTFVVYERVALETEKRASRIAILSVGSVGLLFALIVLIFGGKGEHASPASACTAGRCREEVVLLLVPAEPRALFPASPSALHHHKDRVSVKPQVAPRIDIRRVKLRNVDAGIGPAQAQIEAVADLREAVTKSASCLPRLSQSLGSTRRTVLAVGLRRLSRLLAAGKMSPTIRSK